MQTEQLPVAANGGFRRDLWMRAQGPLRPRDHSGRQPSERLLHPELGAATGNDLADVEAEGLTAKEIVARGAHVAVE